MPWRRGLRQPATRELSVFWRARVALQVAGGLWLVRPRGSSGQGLGQQAMRELSVFWRAGVAL